MKLNINVLPRRMTRPQLKANTWPWTKGIYYRQTYATKARGKARNVPSGRLSTPRLKSLWWITFIVFLSFIFDNMFVYYMDTLDTLTFLIILQLLIWNNVLDGHVGPEILSQASVYRAHIGTKLKLPCNVSQLSGNKEKEVKLILIFASPPAEIILKHKKSNIF